MEFFGTSWTPNTHPNKNPPDFLKNNTTLKVATNEEILLLSPTSISPASYFSDDSSSTRAALSKRNKKIGMGSTRIQPESPPPSPSRKLGRRSSMDLFEWYILHLHAIFFGSDFDNIIIMLQHYKH